MYVWARLARTALSTRQRGPYAFGDQSRLAFRCLPSDIDSNMHLNNARYMMLADVGRIDIFLRAGLLKIARERKWAPMMGGLQSAYVHEIRLWKRFDVISSIETWEGTQVLGRHRFVLEDGRTAALILTAAGIYDRAARHFVPIEDVISALGHHIEPRRPSTEERAFLASYRGLRTMTKRLDSNLSREARSA